MMVDYVWTDGYQEIQGTSQEHAVEIWKQQKKVGKVWERTFDEGTRLIVGVRNITPPKELTYCSGCGREIYPHRRCIC
jgi:hypothetical protein